MCGKVHCKQIKLCVLHVCFIVFGYGSRNLLKFTHYIMKRVRYYNIKSGIKFIL